MKKGAIIALIALATSVAVYAESGGEKNKTKNKAKTECCEKKATCCPTGTATQKCCAKKCD